MGYGRGDDRYGGDNRFGGGDRWRDREQGGRSGGERANFEGGRQSEGRHSGEDRGFFERAGEEVRSWFSDDDDRGGGRHQRERGGHSGSGGFGGGWGNQQGESWNRDRPGAGGYGAGREHGNDWGSGSRSQSGQSGYSGDYQASGGGSDRSEEGSFGQESRSSETWGGSGFGGGTDHGRRFDRIDAGSTGTHGAHPMSSPVGGAYGAGYGASTGGGYGSSARTAAMLGGAGRGGSGASQGAQQGGAQQGQQGGAAFGGSRGGGIHDPHYSQWRSRQIEELDRDYDDYRREHQSKFEQEFGGWREKRQTQRSSLGKVTEHMKVVGSDGQPVGTVDKVREGRIILTKSDETAGGRHHSIPCSWIESVDDQVTVNKTAQEAMNAWQDEERNRALFEREDQGSEGPHMLNRSFSGTYSEDERKE